MITNNTKLHIYKLKNLVKAFLLNFQIILKICKLHKAYFLQTC